jgi:membrane associated rhomboid family serine protease
VGVAVHERVWEQGRPPEPLGMRPFRPLATYTLLGAMLGVFLLEQAVLRMPGTLAYHGWLFDPFSWTFVIDTDWYWRPWTLVTSTLAHDPVQLRHILFNGLMLFFFGPLVERILGARRFVLLFFAAGALSGIAQVHLASALGEQGGALGASGALMALLGFVALLLPRERIFIWGILPVPLWLAGVGYALLDVLGAFDRTSGIGHFAHLSGIALGVAYGLAFKQQMAARGLRLVRT